MADLTTQLQAAAGVGGGWDLSKATFNSGTANYTNLPNNTGGTFYISPDGLNLYYVDNLGNLIQNSLSTPFDLMTISRVRTRSVTSFTTSPFDFTFTPDGTGWVTNSQGARQIRVFPLTTPWDISTITGTGATALTHSLTGAVYLYMRADGLRLFAMFSGSDNLRSWALPTAFSLTGASLNGSIVITSIDSIPTGFWFKDDGTRLYISGDGSNDITELTLATAWNISTISQTRVLNVSAYTTSPFGLQFNPTGDKMFLGTSSFNVTITTFAVRGIYGYSLGTPWDISTAVIDVPPDNAFNVNAFEASPQGCAYSDDGTRFFIIGVIGDEINQFALSTPYNVSTASFTTNVSVAGFDSTPNDFFFSPDGLNLYILGTTNDTVYQFVCATPFTITGLSYTGLSKSLAAQSTSMSKFTFRPDGTYMYVADASSSDILFEYVLGTPWNVSTASYTGVSVSLSSVFPSEFYGGLAFSPDGTKAFILGAVNPISKVYQFNMSTPWDITTLSAGSLTYTYEQPQYFTWMATGLTISLDGLHMAFAGNSIARVAYSIDL